MAAAKTPAGSTATPRRPGRPARTPQERATQRARLLAGAMAAIRTAGPEQSLDELAAAAGVSKPVLYDEFGGKLGLADAIAVELATNVELVLVRELTDGSAFDLPRLVRRAIESLVDLIASEPNIYAFIVRAMRSNDRGFLDNALVRVLHQRAGTVIRMVAPTLEFERRTVLVDGLFGFLFAAIESWQAQAEARTSRDDLVESLSSIISTALVAVGASDAAART